MAGGYRGPEDAVRESERPTTRIALVVATERGPRWSDSIRIASLRALCDKPLTCQRKARVAGDRKRDFHAARLVRDRCLPRHYTPAGTLFPAHLGKKHRGLFRFRPARVVVAGRYVDGGDHVCRRYAAGGGRTGVHAGDRGELDLVGVSAVGNDDGVFVCAIVAAFG